MSFITIHPHSLKGTVNVPPSKSFSHRAIICAALSKGISSVGPINMSDDIRATIDALCSIGAKIEYKNKFLFIDGSETFSLSPTTINCRESGSTLRFLIPVVCSCGINTQFVGEGRLPKRPIGIYLTCLPEFGVSCESNGGLPLSVSGSLKSGTYRIFGNVSSQFISGLMFALPLLDGDSKIELLSELESRPYVDMTIEVLTQFGIEVTATENGWFIKGGQSYTPTNYVVEGDWSQAAFFMAAGAIGSEIKIKGLSPRSIQGDAKFVDILRDFGANIYWENDELIVSKGNLNAINVDASQIPDLVPIIAVVAACANGITRISGAKRLRVKESDRLRAIYNGLKTMNVDIFETDDGLIINGGDDILGANINGANDHRIIMALSIAATTANGDVIISGHKSVNKSYPSFFEDYQLLGGSANVVHMGK